eukprot:1364724-Pleurochrysis_carterae.AAC.1
MKQSQRTTLTVRTYQAAPTCYYPRAGKPINRCTSTMHGRRREQTVMARRAACACACTRQHRCRADVFLKTRAAICRKGERRRKESRRLRSSHREFGLLGLQLQLRDGERRARVVGALGRGCQNLRRAIDETRHADI